MRRFIRGNLCNLFILPVRALAAQDFVTPRPIHALPGYFQLFAAGRLNICKLRLLQHTARHGVGCLSVTAV